VTPTEEARFIALWTTGTAATAIAQALGVPVGTVKSRAHALARQGKIQARPKGGAYPRQKARQVTPAPPPEQSRAGQSRAEQSGAVQSSADLPALSPEDAKAERWNLWLPRGLRQRIEAVEGPQARPQ
jgi:hypothetical protein